ncbi:hypothetical protein [Actinoplanes sp. NPDC023714]|uniref:hypothetical protein n=1 Tax=Actinoplanes sp. NPDC023714 TaxID=3154322 RepID=UPI0033D0BA62
MAIRSWVKLLATTTGAAAVVGAGQLGLAYGLGVVHLDRDLDVTASDQWTSQLAWVAWFAMTAAAVGAIVGTGFRPRWLPQPIGTGGALGLGLAAGLGSLAVLPLTMQPARAAQVAGVNPVFVIGVCAVLGAAVGIFAAWAAAAKAVARWSLATLTVLAWIVALVSIAPSLLPGRTPGEVRLGVLGGSLIPGAVADHTDFVTMPVLALLSGVILGWLARGRRMSTATVALAGLAGPALLTLAYLIAGPGETTGFALNPYWGAMVASGAGVLGSVLAVIVRGAPEREGAAAASSSDTAATTPAATPAADAPPLPRRDAPAPAQQSAIAAAAAAAAQRPEAQLRPSDTGVIPAADRPHPVADRPHPLADRPHPHADRSHPPADRPHPLADLANQAPANAPNSPFTSGTGTPFGQGPSQAGPSQAGPAHAATHQAAAPQAAPAQGRFSPSRPQEPAPRFSGQQEAAPSQRRGWRGRRSGPENPPASPAGSFDGFATGNPGPRTGIDTAEHPRITPRPPVVEPTSISGPPPQRGRGGRQESEYVDWVNGLGGA